MRGKAAFSNFGHNTSKRSKCFSSSAPHPSTSSNISVKIARNSWRWTECTQVRGSSVVGTHGWRWDWPYFLPVGRFKHWRYVFVIAQKCWCLLSRSRGSCVAFLRALARTGCAKRRDRDLSYRGTLWTTLPSDTQFSEEISENCSEFVDDTAFQGYFFAVPRLEAHQGRTGTVYSPCDFYNQTNDTWMH